MPRKKAPPSTRLDVIHDNWNGWEIRKDGRLYSDSLSNGFTPGDILSIHWLHQSIRSLRAEIYTLTGNSPDQYHWHGYRFNDQEQKQRQLPLLHVIGG
jgi:hypothetical protein